MGYIWDIFWIYRLRCPPPPQTCVNLPLPLTSSLTLFFSKIFHMSSELAQQQRMLDDIISTRDDAALALALHQEIAEDMYQGMKRSREDRERDDNCSYHWEINDAGELRLERSSGAETGSETGSRAEGGGRGSAVGECLICQENMRQREQRTLLTCGHSFHTECIMCWLPDHQTCPVCRENVRVAE